MIEFTKAIASESPLLIGKAIAQRKKLRTEKLDLISRLQEHDYSRAISRKRAEIQLEIRSLRAMEDRQRKLPQTIQTIQKDRERLTKQIKLLRAQFPKEKVGKTVKRLHQLDLPRETIEALIRILQSAGS